MMTENRDFHHSCPCSIAAETRCMSDNDVFRSIKSKENVHKKQVGPYRGFGIKAIGDPMNLAKGARGKCCIFERFTMAVVSNTDVSHKYQNTSNLFRK